jgi:hypothetical protein
MPAGGEVVWGIWVVCCVFVVAAMFLGLGGQPSRPAALRAMSAFMVGVFAYSVSASWVAGGRTASVLGALIFCQIGWQVIGWWGDERLATAARRERR